MRSDALRWVEGAPQRTKGVGARVAGVEGGARLAGVLGKIEPAAGFHYHLVQFV